MAFCVFLTIKHYILFVIIYICNMDVNISSGNIKIHNTIFQILILFTFISEIVNNDRRMILDDFNY